MQDNRSEFSRDELQQKQNSESGFTPGNNDNNAQQLGQQRPMQDKNSTLKPDEVDQQEGNMNHGTVGGNFGDNAER